MKRLALLLALLLSLLLLSGCGDAAWFYKDTAVEANGLTFYVNRVNHEAFAGNYHWDGTSDEIVIDIPDQVSGYTVTALGGWYGRGVPAAFGISMPPVYRGMKGNPYVSSPEELRTVSLTVNIGPTVEKINETYLVPAAPITYASADRSVGLLFDLTVTCDERNPVFYAEDGRLFYRADGKPVENLN